MFDRDPQAAAYVHEYASAIAEKLPDIFEMDYPDFYAGSQAQILERYSVAWSIAYFLEVGAPKVRMQPFKNLRKDYLKALVRTRSMHEATAEVLDDDAREDFIDAWLDFWKKQ